MNHHRRWGILYGTDDGRHHHIHGYLYTFAKRVAGVSTYYTHVTTPWNPNTVKFPKAKYELHDIIHDYRLISATQRSDVAQSDGVIDDVSSIFNLTAMHRRICVMKFLQKNPVQQLTRR